MNGNFLRFVDCLQVLPKHLACVCVTSFHIACKLVCVPELAPEPPHIIRISQCKCSLSDIMRMESIIIDKLGINVNERDNLPVTALTFLRLFNEIITSTKCGDDYNQ
jgi:cyclin G2